MSDDEFDYGFEYEGSENEDDVVDVENEYYTAKCALPVSSSRAASPLRQLTPSRSFRPALPLRLHLLVPTAQRDDPDIALASFQKIVDDEASRDEQGEFGFKALKQMTKLTFRHERYDEALAHYKTLLTYTKKGVTRNVAEKAINRILDYVSAEPKLGTDKMQEFYEVTMKALEEQKNDRLSTKTNLKLAKLWLDRHEYNRLNKARLFLSLFLKLHASCAPTDDGADVDSSKGTTQLEVYALEIQMYGELKNNKKLREIYEKSLRVRSAIPHPRIQGVIRECGGKMYMSEKDWTKAQVDFFEAFKAYDEAGSAQRTQVLKYLVLAHMLTESEIDPFDSQETKPYKNDREIAAMQALVQAYQRRDVHEAEKILRSTSHPLLSQFEASLSHSRLARTANRETIMDDPFIRGYIDDVLRSLRMQWILDIIKPYTRIEIAYLARQLGIPNEQVEEIVVALILDEKIQGRIDQVSGRLELDRQYVPRATPASLVSSRFGLLSRILTGRLASACSTALETRRYQTLDAWTSQLVQLQTGMLAKASTAGSDRGGGPGGMGGTMGMGMPAWPGMSGVEAW
ncbi:SPOSA6832_02107, partial [Sporobolomyces salmonicolor]